MDLQELLEMNIEVANHFIAPQVQLPPIMKDMMQSLIELNQDKLNELNQ